MNTTAALEAMRQYYDSGATRSYAFRKEQLLKLKACVIKYEKEIFEALHTDLHKARKNAGSPKTVSCSRA